MKPLSSYNLVALKGKKKIFSKRKCRWNLLVNYLSGFEHELCRVVKESQRSFGKSMGTHEDSRELHICLPWVHHLLGGEALEIKQKQVDESLDKCEIPTIAGTKN